MILPKASCEKCRTITGKIEDTVLRTMLRPLRTRLKMKTRRPKERPSEFDFPVILSSGGVSSLKVAASKVPRSFMAPILDYPGLLVGRGPTNDLPNATMALALASADELAGLRAEVSKMAAGKQDVALHLGQVNIPAFTRMLAKIAHCHAVCCRGVDGFTPILLEHILAGHSTPSLFIGGEPETPPAATGSLHQVQLREAQTADRTSFLIVTIRLFAFMGAPVYHVVAGHPKAADTNGGSESSASTQE